jgi:hypothetical protein
MLLWVEECLDVDFAVNHYFTRSFLMVILDQRGLANKLDSVKRRAGALDEALELLTTASLSKLGVNFSYRQVVVGVSALLATVVFSAASLVISLWGLLK